MPRYITINDLPLLKALQNKPMAPSPATFHGTLQELYDGYIAPNLPQPAVVEYYHALLVEYCRSSRPLFLIRKVPNTERRETYVTDAGERFRATDNAPAWWMHFLLFNDLYIDRDSFANMVEAIPTHFHDVGKAVPSSINTAGWHVAHIYSVKNGETVHQHYDRATLVRRFIRNVHPCNVFYVPKPEWQTYGSQPAILDYFARSYMRRYARVWPEFLQLAQGKGPTGAESLAQLVYNYDEERKISPDESGRGADVTARVHNVPQWRGEPSVVYRYSRLCFMADKIEPLAPQESFAVVTPIGTFQFTKVEFHAEFPNVLKTPSYTTGARMYHYPNVPKRALKYQVS